MYQVVELNRRNLYRRRVSVSMSGRRLLGYLLKWEYQPENRSRSWFLTIREQRRALNRHFHRNPSLKSCIVDALEDGFEAGVDLALRETNLPLRTFPAKCPYNFEEVITDSFICDTSQDWE